MLDLAGRIEGRAGFEHHDVGVASVSTWAAMPPASEPTMHTSKTLRLRMICIAGSL